MRHLIILHCIQDHVESHSATQSVIHFILQPPISIYWPHAFQPFGPACDSFKPSALYWIHYTQLFSPIQKCCFQFQPGYHYLRFSSRFKCYFFPESIAGVPHLALFWTLILAMTTLIFFPVYLPYQKFSHFSLKLPNSS